MTFLTNDRYKKTFWIKDEADPLALSTGYSVYWVFEFANDDIDKIEGIIDRDTAEFEIPENFFTSERRGDLTHRLLICDSDDSPYLYTIIKEDKLVSGGPTKEELGI